MENISDVKTGEAFVYVDNPESLALLTQTLRGISRVSFDTEADSLHHYFEKVCLIQLSVSGRHYIVDPLADMSLTGFFEVLSEKELIIHAADYDLRMLKKTFGFRPKAPVFDTMVAAQVLGYEKIGLAALVEKFFAIVLSKTGQKSDWSRRPLTQAQLVYASDDTKYLETIANLMTEQLQKLGRLEWHRECCERVVNTSGLPPRNEDKDPWRVKGSSKLSPQELAYVRELWKWRDEEARQKDRPPFMTMLNEDLVTLAQWLVQNPKVPFFNGPIFLKRISGDKLERLEKAVQTASGIPSSQWPQPLKREWSEERPTHGRLEPLLDACKALAQELKIEACFLASRACLTGVAQNTPRSVEEVMEAGGLMRWQAELLMPAIQRGLSKKG